MRKNLPERCAHTLVKTGSYWLAISRLLKKEEKMESDLTVFKKIFSDSHENVFILNYSFDILWHNVKDMLCPFCNADFSQLFENENKPIESGKYFLLCQSLEFAAELINYREQELYILRISREDVMSSLTDSRYVREFFGTQAAMIRQAVSGITTAKNILHDKIVKKSNTDEEKVIDEKTIKECSNYLNIISGNSCQLLKTVMAPTELIKYSDSSGKAVKIDLSGELNEIISNCSKLLKNQIRITADISAGLFIKADPDRLTTFILSLIAFTLRHFHEGNAIKLCAMRASQNVSITLSAEISRKNIQKDYTVKLFSRYDEIYSSESSYPELIVINRFCHEFGGRLYDCKTSENGEVVICVRLPFCDEPDKAPFLSSHSDEYDKNRFSVYRIVLSDIADIY